jgi:hypothetical protein
MSKLFRIASLLFLLPAAGGYRHVGKYVLPNATLTPGDIRTTDATLVCTGGPTAQYRLTTEGMKKQVCAMYGVGHCPWEGHLEIDHLIPLELGGADEIKNLWPQPAPDYKFKDKLENELHREVCAGKTSLSDAQNEIKSDWTASYRKRIKVLPQ